MTRYPTFPAALRFAALTRATFGPLLLLSACMPTTAMAGSVRLNARLSKPVVMAGQVQTAYLKVGLTGSDRGTADRQRTPVNIAIVLDRSSSMGGDKIAEARRAAVMTVNSLRPDDVVSVIAYDSVVEVVVPATSAADRAGIIAAIEQVQAGGMTALFAGVAKGAAELRKFYDRNRVNRVILLSDGIANVGPSAPGALAELGESLGKEGISVTTVGLGLGYNEDLMFQLAMAADGNHAFVEHATDLARVFEYEFGDVFSVVAQDVDVRIECNEGIRPLRVLGRDALIAGNTVTAHLNQLYTGQEKFLLLEVEVAALPSGFAGKVVSLSVDYADMKVQKPGHLDGEILLETTRSAARVNKRTDHEVVVEAIAMVATEQSQVAIALRDEGKIDEAEKLLRQNELLLRDKARDYKSKKLKRLELRNKDSADNLDEKNWGRTRKQMRKFDFEEQMQQSY